MAPPMSLLGAFLVDFMKLEMFDGLDGRTSCIFLFTTLNVIYVQPHRSPKRIKMNYW